MLAAGTIARVDSNVSRHFSPARLLALGVLGATAKKGEVYLYFTNADGVDIEMVKLPKGSETIARQWAVEFNREAVSRKTDASPHSL